MQKEKKNVFVALSGGVDSSVGLYLLKKAGYNVTAVFIKIGEHLDMPDDGSISIDECWVGERRDAMRVAAYLKIPFLTFDFDKEYKREVLDYFFREYQAGRTANPDVMCNRKIKFPLFWKKARALGADLMATGHYARIGLANSGISNFQFPIFNKGVASRQIIKKYKLLVGKDKEKDQSYFLYNLKSRDLEHILFPIGNYTKKEVRDIARRAGLPTAEKKESQGLCFLGQIKIKEFLKTRIKSQKGEIIDAAGRKVGEHDGLFYYTIGQRHGLGVFGGGKSYFIVGKDFQNNRLIVAAREEEKKFYKSLIELEDINWIGGKPKFSLRCQARIRYRAPLEDCKVFKKNKLAVVKFDLPQRAVTPGQSMVFYRKDEVLGGGVIR